MELVSRVELAEVFQVGVVHCPLEVGAIAAVTGGHAPDHARRRPAQRAAREPHHGLAYTWNGHQAVRLRFGIIKGVVVSAENNRPPVGGAEAGGWVGDTLAGDQRQDFCQDEDASASLPGSDVAPVFDVALHEAREVGDGIAHAWLFGSPVPGKVGSENTMLGPRGFEVVPPLHVAGRPEPVDEHDRCAAAAVHVVNTQRSDLDELGLN